MPCPSNSDEYAETLVGIEANVAGGSELTSFRPGSSRGGSWR